MKATLRTVLWLRLSATSAMSTSEEASIRWKAQAEVITWIRGLSRAPHLVMLHARIRETRRETRKWRNPPTHTHTRDVVIIARFNIFFVYFSFFTAGKCSVLVSKSWRNVLTQSWGWRDYAKLSLEHSQQAHFIIPKTLRPFRMLFLHTDTSTRGGFVDVDDQGGGEPWRVECFSCLIARKALLECGWTSPAKILIKLKCPRETLVGFSFSIFNSIDFWRSSANFHSPKLLSDSTHLTSFFWCCLVTT